MSNTDFEFEPDPDDGPEYVVDDPVEEDDGIDDQLLADDVSIEDDVEDDEPRNSEDDRIETLRKAAEDARLQAAEDRVRREMLERQLNDRAAREDPALEAERLALMSVEERAEYKVNKALRDHEQRLARQNFEIADRADRSAFESKASVDPLYARFHDQVEAQLSELRRNGQNIERERLFKYLVGEHVLSQRGQRESGAQPRRSQNVDRQRTQPVRGRTDVRTERRSVADSPAKRLEGVSI